MNETTLLPSEGEGEGKCSELLQSRGRVHTIVPVSVNDPLT